MYVNAGRRDIAAERDAVLSRCRRARPAAARRAVRLLGRGRSPVQRSGRFPPRLPGGPRAFAELRSLFVPFNGVWPRYFTTVGIELLVRTYHESQGKPIYVIKERRREAAASEREPVLRAH